MIATELYPHLRPHSALEAISSHQILTPHLRLLSFVQDLHFHTLSIYLMFLVLMPELYLRALFTQFPEKQIIKMVLWEVGRVCVSKLLLVGVQNRGIRSLLCLSRT